MHAQVISGQRWIANRTRNKDTWNAHVAQHLCASIDLQCLKHTVLQSRTIFLWKLRDFACIDLWSVSHVPGLCSRRDLGHNLGKCAMRPMSPSKHQWTCVIRDVERLFSFLAFYFICMNIFVVLPHLSDWVLWNLCELWLHRDSSKSQWTLASFTFVSNEIKKKIFFLVIGVHKCAIT